MALGENNHVDFFTKRSFAEEIKEDLGDYEQQITFHLYNDLEPTFLSLEKIRRYCDKNLDVVLAKTLTSASFASFRPTCKFMGFVYNLNWWFKDIHSSSAYLKNIMNLRNIIYPSLIYNALTGVLVRKLILTNLDAVLVEYPPFVDFTRKDCMFDKPVYFLPNRSSTEETSHNYNNQIVNFVIPGQIHDIRRDYDFAINAIQQIPEHLYDKFSLTLLGNPKGKYGKRILGKCDKLAAQGVNIEYTPEFVSTRIFNKKMAQSDIVIVPLKEHFNYGAFTERFTYTKGTGSFSDAIRFSKPSLVPDFYNLTNDLQKCFIKYKSPDDLCHIMIKYISDKTALQELKSHTETCMKSYSLSICQHRFQGIISEVIQQGKGIL